jgi:hypothetical protein
MREFMEHRLAMTSNQSAMGSWEDMGSPVVGIDMGLIACCNEFLEFG